MIFNDLFTQVQNLDVDVDTYVTGFARENTDLPYICLNPVEIVLDQHYSCHSQLRTYDLDFCVFAENRRKGRILEEKLHDKLQGFATNDISIIQIQSYMRDELFPGVYRSIVNFKAHVNHTIPTTYSNLTGTGENLQQALFDLYNQAELKHKIVLSDYMLETDEYPYICLANEDIFSTDDDTCEAEFAGKFELGLFTDTFSEAELIGNKLISLFNFRTLTTTDYIINNFSWNSWRIKEVFPQVWQNNLIFDFGYQK